MAISASSKILASDISGISATANAAYSYSFITKGINPIANSEQDTPAMWANLGSGVYWFTESRLIDQPSNYGFLINYTQHNDVFQIWSCQNSGPVRFRQGNANGWGITWNHNAAWADNCNWANGADACNCANTLAIAGRRVMFAWSGQAGQPDWVWGGSESTLANNQYLVYNPANFNVNYANSAGWANSGYSTACPNVVVHQSSADNGSNWGLPAGGTWRVLCWRNNNTSATAGDYGGGTTISYTRHGIAIRVA